MYEFKEGKMKDVGLLRAVALEQSVLYIYGNTVRTIPNLFYPNLDGRSALCKNHTFLAKTSMWLEPLFLGFTDRGLSEEACFHAGEQRK
jgi:hypothetical protein